MGEPGFADDDLRAQAGRGQAALLQLLGQRGNQRRLIELGAMAILAPDQPPAQKARRLIVELRADFFADAAPGLRLSLHLRRLDWFFDELQISRPAWLIVAPPGRSVLRG